MNREEIMGILPHRDDMLLIDEAEVKDGVAYGKYRVRGDEWFLKGHFPGNPIVPGVILCEIMAQSACMLLKEDTTGDTVPLFTSLDGVRFKNSVKPGDLFETVCVLNKRKGPFYFVSGKGTVGGRLCVSGDFSFALVGG